MAKIIFHFQQRANNDTYIVAGLCVVIMIVGYSIHYRIASITAEKHSKNLEEMSNQLQAEYNSVKLRAMQATLPEGKYGNASIRASIVRNDNEAGDHVREYDERMERLHKLRQRRAAKKLIIEENEKVKEAQEDKDNNEAQNHAVATNWKYRHIYIYMVYSRVSINSNIMVKRSKM